MLISLNVAKSWGGRILLQMDQRLQKQQVVSIASRAHFYDEGKILLVGSFFGRVCSQEINTFKVFGGLRKILFGKSLAMGTWDLCIVPLRF